MSYNLLNMATTDLAKGVVHCFNEESTLFTACPVLDVKGNATAYNQVSELFEVEKRELGQDVVNIQEMTTTKVIEPLEIFSNSVKVDRAMCMMSDTDLRATETEVQAKSMARGCHKAILSKLKANAGVKVVPTGAMPTAEEVAEAMDNMRFVDGAMLMLCNSKTNRALQKEAINQGFTYGQVEAFGRKLYQFNNVPVQVTADLEDGEVLVVYFSVAEGVCLASNGGIITYDQGLKGVFYVTDMELLAVPVIKNTKAVAFVGKTVGKTVAGAKSK